MILLMKWNIFAGKKEIKIEHNLLITYKECIELYKKENEICLKDIHKQAIYMIGLCLWLSEEKIYNDLQQK